MRILTMSIVLISFIFGEGITLPKSFKSNFKQSITNTKGVVISYSGSVNFTNNKSFKWNYIEPTKKEVCTDNEELLVVDHDLEQVSYYLISKGVDIAKILASARLYKDSVYTTIYDSKNYTIKLDNNKKLHSIAYYDNLDNKVQILFEKMQYLNKILDKKRLLCNYPNNYDIISD